MKKNNLLLSLISIINTLLILGITPQIKAEENTCLNSVWSRMTNYQIQTNDTLENIATRYNLLPETLIRVNPNLNTSRLTGKTIKIPPFNGMIIKAPSGSTWQDLAEAYGIRADLLFELNGCTSVPQEVFIPGISWATTNITPAQTNQNNQLPTYFYPLLHDATIGLNYGWQTNPENESTFFHSGIDLLANAGDSVRAMESGIVAFAGGQGNYGNLIVINHQDGKQTRYAHLGNINVTVGQTIQAGDIIGLVGNSGLPDLTATHLHFEVRLTSPQGWVAQDPLLYLNLNQNSN